MFKKLQRWIKTVGVWHAAVWGGRVAVSATVLYFALLSAWFSISAPPQTDAENLRLTVTQLNFLEDALKSHDAAGAMQKYFPEGACFIVSLYGFAWANVAEQTSDPELKHRAQTEMLWALEKQNEPLVVRPFTETQVRRGVFWLGQRNYLLGRFLETTPPADRLAEKEEEFHNNFQVLTQAFIDSPTHHLDSYPAMCWPADNVTALASLLIHDRVYRSTQGNEAYTAWKTWTTAHSDPATGLPAGRLDSRNGSLGEPARGCANSWIIGLLAREDPEYTVNFYQSYLRCFSIRRLGFGMFREYPAGCLMQADVDSGPILWGAGVVATGVGLGASRACGDSARTTDIHALSQTLAFPATYSHNKRPCHSYLFGMLPMGDAFLAWGNSIPSPKP